MFDRIVRSVALVCLGLVLLLPQATPTQAAGRPILSLPTPPGETWEVIQGYNCGTHDGWGRLSFDLVNHNGRTRGAPVYAAADGTMWYAGGGTNVLIMKHSDGYYTMYSHMQTRIDVPRGTFIARGTQVGTVGAVNPTPTVPHLHFTFFRADGDWGENRRPVPLSFVEGYDFPDTGKCNAHGGALLVAGSTNDAAAPTIDWTGSPAQSWVAGGRVDWTVSDNVAVRGFSQAWDSDPLGAAPAFEGATSGYLDLTLPGKHTIFVRAWDKAGNQTLATREVWYDPIAPAPPAAEASVHTMSSDQPVTLSWGGATDSHSGVKGYQIYLGPNPEGTSDWFVPSPEVGVGLLSVGTHYLRARAQDNAGNFSAWVTLDVITVEPR